MEMNSCEGEEHVEHFLHEHPLTLLQVHHGKYCKICTEKIRGPAYACASSASSCKFYLHKSCGELPQEIQHHPVHHPDHCLILRGPASYAGSWMDGCDGCYSRLRGFVYRCRQCNFDLHSDCAQYMTPTVKFQGHDRHLLTLVEEMPLNMECKACLFDISCTFFLRCVECNVNFHVQCGPHPLPLTIVDQHHSHPLSLTTPERLINNDDDDLNLLLYCDTCNKERNPKHPFYSCAECDYSVHVRCVVTEVPRKPSIKIESHNHALIYMEELGGNPKCRANCKITTRRVPYLRCFRCPDFNIHFMCSPLPQNIRHWSHPHSLKLMNDFVDYNYDVQMCDVCETKRDPRDFVYYCAECYFVAEFECVFHEVMQSLEKEPRDVRLECAGFKIDFVFDQLKRIVLANYATDTEIYRNRRLYKIRKEMDKISRQIEDLTARKEQLIRDTRDIISTAAHDSDLDSSTDFVQFRMNKASTGLL